MVVSTGCVGAGRRMGRAGRRERPQGRLGMSWPRAIVASSVSQTRTGAAQLVESIIPALLCVHASAGRGQPAARLPLGAVHRLVGCPEQRLRVSALLGVDGDTKADRELDQELVAAAQHGVV